MFIFFVSLNSLLVIGDNSYKQLCLDSPASITQFMSIPNANGMCDIIALGEKGGYMVKDGAAYISGEAFKFENQNVPSPPFGPSTFLSGKKIKDVSISSVHAIALDRSGNVFTLGSNANKQLGRQTNDPNSAGQATLPNWNEKIVKVGAIKSLSFIFYETAVFYIGKCESCLCGNDDAGNAISGVKDTWQKFKMDIEETIITKVYLGEQQFVLQLENNSFYYVGKTKFGAGCGSKESYCTPTLLPFNQAIHIYLSANVTAVSMSNNEIHFCGCQYPGNCTNQSTFTKLNYTIQSKSRLYKAVQLHSHWYIIEDTQITRCSNLAGSFICSRQNRPTGTLEPTAITGYNNSAIAFKMYRYNNIVLSGSGNVNVTICGNNLGQQTLPYSQNNEISYNQTPYGTSCQVEITSTNTYKILDKFVIYDTNITKEYNIRQFPYQGITSFNIYLKFRLENGQDISDPFNVEIKSIIQNNTIVLPQQEAQAWRALAMDLTKTGLYDTYNITITTHPSQMRRYHDKTFRYQVTQPDENISVIMQKIEETYFLVVDQSTGTPLSGVVLQFYYEQWPNHIFRNNETTNATGYITITRLPTDTNQAFNLLYKYDSNGSYNSINFTYQWIQFDASTVTVQLSQSGAFVTVSVTHGRAGRVELFAQNGTSLTNITFPTNNIFNQYSKRVQISPSWNAQGQQVTGKYTDPNNVYYAPDITQALNDGVSYNFQVSNAQITVKFRLSDQNQNRVKNHQILISTDGKVSNQTLTTNNNGNVNTTINQLQLSGGKLWVWVNPTDKYDGISERSYTVSQLQQRIDITVYKFVTFNISLNVMESVTGSTISGIEVSISNSATPNATLLNGATNQQGHIEFIVNETENILVFNQNYIVTITDPKGLLSTNHKNIYLTSENVVLDVIMNANLIRFQIVDNITHQIAQGAAVQFRIGQQLTNGISDIDGNINIDVTGTFTQNQLYYQVVESNIYKPQAWKRFRYSLSTIQLTAESWLNMTLKLSIVDGGSQQPLDNMDISIFTEAGDLQYNELTTQTGYLWLNFSEREGIINLYTVYNLSIVDTLNRYQVFNVNFSVSVPDEETLIPMDLQQLLIIITNFDAQRVGNVTVDLFADEQLLYTKKSNALGITLFYLQNYEFSGRNLTYFVHQSKEYRPKGPLKVTIKKQPQNVVRRVFPLVIYNFTFNLTEPQNESQNINTRNLLNQKLMYQTEVKGNNEVSNIKQYIINTTQFPECQLNEKEGQLSLLTDNQPPPLPEVQIINFSIIFYNNTGKQIFNTTIEDIYDPISLLFVENINQTFVNNARYKFEIIDNTNTYFNINGQFRNILLSRNFDFQLKRRPPPRFSLPWWVYLLILTGILAISFLIYAIKRLVSMKRAFRKVSENKSILLSQESFFEEEQAYIREETDQLNMFKIKTQVEGHVIVRNKLKDDNLDIYQTIQKGDNNIIQNAQILLKAKLQQVTLIQ